MFHLFHSLLGICAEDLWIRTDFDYEVRWQGGHPFYKIILPHTKENNKGRKTNANFKKTFLDIVYSIGEHSSFEEKCI